jgi:hypothetical protein
MKTVRGPFVRSLALISAFIFLPGSCVLSPGSDPAGQLVGRTHCKSSGRSSSGVASAPTSSQECIEYEYDGRSVLRLKHVNAGFNCCPGTISAEITAEGGEIRIKESESSSLCDCSCLYDLDYEFTGVKPGLYRISVVGPYQWEGDPPLDVRVTLIDAASGSHCVERTRYPWGY